LTYKRIVRKHIKGIDHLIRVLFMTNFSFFNSFRVRLMLVMAALLIATLGVTYFLNLRAQQHNARVVAEQEQALAAGVELGVRSISSTDRLTKLRGDYPVLAESAGRVQNVLVIDNNWNVYDNLDPAYQPGVEDGVNAYKQLKDVPLPRVINPGHAADDLVSQVQQTASQADSANSASAPRAFPFPVETDSGRWYVIVVLGRANPPTGFLSREVFRPLIYMLAVLLAATLVAAILVWRFTRPIRDLSLAARRVAQGDFSFQVPAAERRDEMGSLSRLFNEMIGKLERTRELEAQLHQAEQSAVVGRLASAIAHEIRNPLNYINLTLDHLRNAFAPQDPQKRATFERLAVQLKAEVARINTRISEFLNYTRPRELEMKPLDVRAEIEDALRMVEVDAAEHGVKIDIIESDGLPMVIGDARALRSVFTNLFINSLHAINSDGGNLTITITPKLELKTVQIDVADSGRGIAPEDISKIFEPYFSTKETGTGLGLAIVKKIVDGHGGTIGVISKLGEGTTFTINLPSDRKDNW
jgi:signal transduction histidine kinase